MTLRYLFQNPSEAELEDWVNEFGNGAWVDFAGFADLISQKWKKIDTELELRAAFRVFDRGHSPVGRSSRSWSSQVRPNSWRAERTAPAWRSSAARMPGAIPGGLGWCAVRC